MTCNKISIGVILRNFALGGSERIAIGLANFWASQNLDVVLFVGSKKGDMASLLHPNIQVQSVSIPFWLPKKALAWWTAWQAGRYFLHAPVNACYIPGNGHWPIAWTLSRLPLPARPAILAQISSPVFKKERSAWAQKLYNKRLRFLLSERVQTVTLSERLAKDVNHILGRATTRVIPLPTIWHTAPLLPVTVGNKHILAAGRLVRVKGFDNLIQAFSLTKAQNPDAHLTICGEGPERVLLEKLINKLGLTQHVSLVGYVPCIREWLDKSRFLVMSSHAESYGAVLVEALAAGRQIVTTDCSPAVEDLLKIPTAGRSVPVDDNIALAKAMSALLNTPPPDPEELAQLTKPYSIVEGGAAYLELLRSISIIK